ncbi:unnamed protein product [Closterium sp. Naga37s-1]|nr:unnamed protein product [Closterium sp. Naga37s-1]
MVLMDGFSHGVDNPTNGWSGRGVEAGGQCGSGIDRKHHSDARFPSSNELVKAAQLHNSDNHGDVISQFGRGLNCATPFLEDGMFDGLLTGDAAIHDLAAWTDPALRFAEGFLPSSGCNGVQQPPPPQQQQQQRGEAAQQEAAGKRPLVDSAFHREFQFDSMPAMRAAESLALERALTAADRAAAVPVASAGVPPRGATEAAAEPAGAAAPFLAVAGMTADAGGMDGMVGVTGGTAGWARATDADMLSQLLANSRTPLATDMDLVSQVRLRMDPALLASLDAMRAHSQHHALQQAQQAQQAQQGQQGQQGQHGQQAQLMQQGRQLQVLQQAQAGRAGGLPSVTLTPELEQYLAAAGKLPFPDINLPIWEALRAASAQQVPPGFSSAPVPTPAIPMPPMPPLPRITGIPPSPSIFGSTEDVRAVHAPSASDAELRARLLRLAEAVATSEQGEMAALTRVLRADATPHGTPMQRVVHYLLGALGKRASGSLGEEYVVEPLQTAEVSGVCMALGGMTAEEEALILAFAARNPLLQHCYTTMACGIVGALERLQCPPMLTSPLAPLPRLYQEEALILAFAARNPLMQHRYTTMACSIVDALEHDALVHIEEALILAFAARNPLMQHCYTTMACGIVDALEHDPLVHIVDFAMWGGQWPIVIRQLAASAARRRRESCTHGCAAVTDGAGASSSGGSRSSSNSNGGSSGACPTCTGPLPLHIRYTAVEPPPGHPWGAGPKIPIPFLQAEVSGAAAECGVALSFHRVEARPETLRPLMLGVERGEAVVVNCAGRLANLADSTVLRSSPKDTALSTILQLAPKVVTIVEWDANHRQPFFLHRFRDCLDFFSNVFHSHEHLASRASFGRRGFEDRVLAREMINLVACEGLQRLVRAETLDQLHERMQRIGFAPKPFSRRSMAALGQMLAPYSKGFSVVSHPLGGVQLLWQGGREGGAAV